MRRSVWPRGLRMFPMLVASVLLGAVQQASAAPRLPSANGDWTQLHYDAAHAGYDPFETVLDPSTVAGLRQKWSTPIGGSAIAPSVVGGAVYAVTREGNVVAVDAATGLPIWKQSIGPGRSQAVDGGVVYASGTKFARAFDASTGSLLWDKSFGGNGGEITLAGGVLYAGVRQTIVAIDPATGDSLWRRQFSLVGGDLAFAPTVVGNVVYISFDGGHIFALDAGSGSTVWSHQGTTTPFTGSPVVTGEVLYTGSNKGGVSAFDAATGTFLWKTNDYSQGPDHSTPAVAAGRVYYEAQAKVYAFDANGIQGCSGNPTVCQPLWTFSAPANDEFQYSSPAVANGVVYVAGALHLFALDAGSGSRLWFHSNPGGLPEPSPVISNGVVYVGSSSGHLVAYGLP